MREAFAVELVKFRRSRLPALTMSASALAAALGGMFMFILQDPERAHRLGLLGAKAELSGAVADWPGYWALLTQITAVGGVGIFGVLLIWIFGREFSDHTAKDLLALPTSRTRIVAAKFVLTGAWCLLLTAEAYAVGLLIGAILRLPGWSAAQAWPSLGRLAATATMTWLLLSTVAFAASAGRGYLAAVGVLFAILIAAQIVAALGYGHLFPWSVPGIYSGLAGAGKPAVGVLGFTSVGAVGLGGIAATLWWWRDADQSR